MNVSSNALSANRIRAAAALVVLSLGTLLYVLARPSDQVPVLSALNVSHLLPAVVGGLGSSLPTFAHVFAFSLLTAVLLDGGRRVCLAACLAWFFVDTAFEVAQHRHIGASIAEVIPDWFEAVPILDQAGSYFVAGIFDPWDLMSIALGAGAAYVLTLWTAPKVEHHE